MQKSVLLYGRPFENNKTIKDAEYQIQSSSIAYYLVKYLIIDCFDWIHSRCTNGWNDSEYDPCKNRHDC